MNIIFAFAFIFVTCGCYTALVYKKDDIVIVFMAAERVALIVFAGYVIVKFF